MQPVLPPSAPSPLTPAADSRPAPAGEIRIGSQLARVISPAGLHKLTGLLDSRTASADLQSHSTDLQIKG
ncbi:MAG: hypothetical protein ACAI44_12955 [Candidatus Sericytochromatia bacterium]